LDNLLDALIPAVESEGEEKMTNDYILRMKVFYEKEEESL